MNRELQVYEDVFLEAESGSSGFDMQIVGLKPQHYMILDLAVENLRASKLKADEEVWVRCLEPPVCRFRTRVLQITEDPPLVILEYPDPEAIEEVERRGGGRKKILFRATCMDLQSQTREHTLQGYVLDISDSGCLMLVDSALASGRDVLLSFRIPWSEDEIQAKARVVRSRFTDRGIQSGLQFIELDPDSQHRLDEFIRSFEED